jgi:hypothetical protein
MDVGNHNVGDIFSRIPRCGQALQNPAAVGKQASRPRIDQYDALARVNQVSIDRYLGRLRVSSARPSNFFNCAGVVLVRSLSSGSVTVPSDNAVISNFPSISL